MRISIYIGGVQRKGLCISRFSIKIWERIIRREYENKTLKIGGECPSTSSVRTLIVWFILKVLNRINIKNY